MLLSDLLRVLREDILHDRSDRVAGAQDYLWSDTTLIGFMNEAQRRFARRSLCIRDATPSSLTQFTTVAYQENYPLDPSVVAVISARFMGNGIWSGGAYTGSLYPDKADLARAGHSQLSTYTVPDTYFFNPSELARLTPGKPMAFTTDEGTTVDSKGSRGTMLMRLYPPPDVDYAGCTVQLRICRLPQTSFTLENLDIYPEIPEDYHLPMLDYAAYLALRIVDHELGDPARAAEFLKSFEAHVDEARREMLRKLFSPELWGFGRNGWAYEGN
jgi:hypothetical protein